MSVTATRRATQSFGAAAASTVEKDMARTRPLTAAAICFWAVVGVTDSACAVPAAQHVELRGDVVFYLPFDDSLRANLPTAGIGLEPMPTAEMEMAGAVPQSTFGPGVRGRAVFFDRTFGPYVHEVLRNNEVGTVMCWAKHDWTADTTESHTMFQVGVRLPTMGSLFRYSNQPYWQWVAWYHHIDQRHTYGPTASLSKLGAGEWYHVAATWSWPERVRRVYLNGDLLGEKAIERPLGRAGGLWAGTAVGGGHPLNGWIDELYMLDEPLTPAAVKKAYQAGLAGDQAYVVGPPPPAEKLEELPAADRTPPPEWVRWDFDGAVQRHNAFRSEVTLNSWWRWQACEKETIPPAPGEWRYRKVPSGDGRGERFYVFSAGKGPLRDLKPDEDVSWYEREFPVPGTWAGRRIELEIDEISGRSAVYVNRRLAAEVPSVNAGTTVDLTERVRPGATAVVTVRTKGLVGNLWLRSLPKATRLRSRHIATSVRRGEVRVVCRVFPAISAGMRVAAEVFADAGEEESVLRFRPTPVSRGSATLTAELPDGAKLWSLEEPHLHWYRTELLDASGRTIDRTFPRRFGFREFRIENDRFLLNGASVFLYGHSHPHFMTTAETGMPGFARYMIRRWKDAGLTATYNWTHSRSLHRAFAAADEIGFLFVPKMLPAPASRGEPTSDYMAGYRRLLQRIVDKYRDHPSIVAWMVNPGGSHVWDFCPAKLGNTFAPGELDFTQSLVERLRASREEVRHADPSRVGFHHSAGNEGPLHGSMAYMTFDVGLRERANWPKAWSRTRHKPLLVCEWGLPMSSGWYARTRAARLRYPHHRAVPLYTQYAAMYFGPEAYSWEADETLERLSKPGAWGAFGTCGTVLRLKRLFAEENLRAWRTYGISFFFHAEVPSFFSGDTPTLDLGIDPRIEGAVPDYVPSHISAVWQSADGFSPLGETVKRLLAPVHAYIGGPAGDFTNTDHAFFPGETVRKALVVINDSPREIAVSGEWSARDADHVLARGRLRGTVGGGARAITAFPVEFGLPTDVEARRNVEILATWRADAGEEQAARLQVELLPRRSPPAGGGRGVVLFDPAGDTRSLLKRTGLDLRDMSGALRDHDSMLLVIGRRALTSEDEAAALTDAGLDEAVRRGMNVLVFEQAPDGWEGTVMGLRVRETSTRYAFGCAEGHPALTGITNTDLHHWRGDSDLVEAYQQPAARPKHTYDYPLRFWHWGNDNIVATYVIEKPQVGAARALVECGFDLSETPLLEVAVGKGRAIFCQLDVTNRYGVDPAATRIVDNLLTYLRGTDAPDREAVDLTGLAREACGHGEFATLYRSVGPEGRAGWGIGPGDLFLRKATRVPVFGGGTPLFRAVGARGRRVLICSLSAAELDDEWIRGKAARIEAALRINAGLSSTVGPALADPPDLYPIEWRQVERLDGPFDPYLYWRW